MSAYQRVNGHSVSNLSAHIVWVTKCRYPVLKGEFRYDVELF